MKYFKKKSIPHSCMQSNVLHIKPALYFNHNHNCILLTIITISYALKIHTQYIYNKFNWKWMTVPQIVVRRAQPYHQMTRTPRTCHRRNSGTWFQQSAIATSEHNTNNIPNYFLFINYMAGLYFHILLLCLWRDASDGTAKYCNHYTIIHVVHAFHPIEAPRAVYIIILPKGT